MSLCIENESLLALSQKIAHLGSWKLDLTANRLTWSDEAYRIFGCRPQEFAATYEAFIDIVHPEDRSAVDTAYAQSLKDASAGYEIEHRIVRKDTGEVRYVHEQCIHEQDSTGAIIQSIGMVQDITQRKQAEMKQLEHIQELQRWQAATMGREGRVLELKREVNELLSKAGQPVRYPSATIG
ncbi:MAG: PAS domain-containing protein [Deltaproteobacteria bacterium]|nr:PAS domain-containing protein [Deltaproteobacteria bacterium]